MKHDTLLSLFTYHRPHGTQAERYEQLRAGGRVLAQLINELAPESAEKTLAIRRVQEAVMYANAAIACNEMKPVESCVLCGLPILPTQDLEVLPGAQCAHAECVAKRSK